MLIKKTTTLMSFFFFFYPLKCCMFVLFMQVIGFCFLRPSLSHPPRRSTMALELSGGQLSVLWGFGSQAVLSRASRLFQKAQAQSMEKLKFIFKLFSFFIFSQVFNRSICKNIGLFYSQQLHFLNLLL
jgi:hypothetical protein